MRRPRSRVREADEAEAFIYLNPETFRVWASLWASALVVATSGTPIVADAVASAAGGAVQGLGISRAPVGEGTRRTKSSEVPERVVSSPAPNTR